MAGAISQRHRLRGNQPQQGPTLTVSNAERPHTMDLRP